MAKLTDIPERCVDCGRNLQQSWHAHDCPQLSRAPYRDSEHARFAAVQAAAFARGHLEHYIRLSAGEPYAWTNDNAVEVGQIIDSAVQAGRAHAYADTLEALERIFGMVGERSPSDDTPLNQARRAYLALDRHQQAEFWQWIRSGEADEQSQHRTNERD